MRGLRRFYENSKGELATSDALRGKKVWIGVETKLPDGDGVPESVTFGHLSRADLDAALAEVEAVASRHRSFQGIAIHHYSAFRELTERSAEPKRE